MNYILFDEQLNRNNLKPLSLTRPLADLRIGILTVREKWEIFLNSKTSTLTEKYLRIKFPIVLEHDNVLINASVLPTKQLAEQIKNLKIGEELVSDSLVVAKRVSTLATKKLAKVNVNQEVDCINFCWDIFQKNGKEIKADYDLLTLGKISEPISKTNTIIGTQIFLEKGAKVECAILNATEGPIYIGKDAEIMEGSIIRGGFALCEHAVTKMGAKIYGPTTVGPHCRVGGEISNSVLMGYTNKGHDGFLGNSVLGEWCNLGADTNNSNLKNNYGNVSVWSYATKSFVDTGLQFCGLIMGDHSKCGINTMFNTGTVVGVFANIYGGDFPPKFVPSFSWGGSSGFTTYKFDKAYEVAVRVCERRKIPVNMVDAAILKNIFKAAENNKV